MSKKEQVIWGIIGAGDVAEVKSGPALQKCAQSTLKAVMRRNAVKAEDFARRHKVPDWYDSVEALLEDDEINAIYIATPPSSHLEYALKALRAGKHVYLEKPMTLTVKEARILENEVISGNQKLTVAHYRRKLPAFLKIRELLEQNRIGDVRFAKIEIFQSLKTDLIAKTDENWRVKPKISGGGYFYDIAPHQLDLMNLYFGQVASAYGFGVNQAGYYEAADIVNGIISYTNGIQVQGLWSFNMAEQHRKDNCTIYGSTGTISFSFYGDQVILQNTDARETFKFNAWKHVQQPMIQATVNYFLNKAQNPCSVTEGRQNIELLEQLTRQ